MPEDISSYTDDQLFKKLSEISTSLAEFHIAAITYDKLKNQQIEIRNELIKRNYDKNVVSKI